ncbi:hypothetical protein [Flavobacterium enshiense]|uniref:Uncharacterized protein n=1 Tax=Flavobacterium enshiense DK69 TaxID=1107311 RepID=A0A0A2MQS3_9FLAO|nr:hypothetical protein [Flavobacterium enshiense]KGO93818.1 hypothetical protein Q767_14150 [Flavobacterium enshiense DK69]
MSKDYIDKFFDSMSEGVLKEKWKKYEKYSNKENSVKISELLESWNHYYENAFSIEDVKLDLSQNVIVESEQCFGLLF